MWVVNRQYTELKPLIQRQAIDLSSRQGQAQLGRQRLDCDESCPTSDSGICVEDRAFSMIFEFWLRKTAASR